MRQPVPGLRLWERVPAALLQRQDSPGRLCLATSLVSGALEVARLLAVSGILPLGSPLFMPLAWLSQHLSLPLWGASVAAGFVSEKRVPRALAYTSLLIIGLTFAGHLTGLPQVTTVVGGVLRIGAGLLLALPTGLADLWRRLRHTADDQDL